MALILVNHLIEIFLHQKQLQCLKKSFNEVPMKFKESISLEDHRKSILYSKDKLIYHQFQLVWKAALLVYWFPLKGADSLFSALPLAGLHKDVFFILIFFLINAMINIPWKIYFIFVIEKKHGFNKTTPKLFFQDMIKGGLLSLLFSIPLFYSLFYLYQKSPQWWWLFGFFFISLFQLFVILIYPSFIAPLFNKFTPLEKSDLHQKISELLKRAQFTAKDIFVMDASRRSRHGNAYFTGLSKSKRIVFFDTLLEKLNHQEILAILAHELGHMKRKHITKSLVLSFVMMFCGFFIMGKIAPEDWFYQGHFMTHTSPGVLFLLFMEMTPLYFFWLSPLSSWLSRKNEFEADEYAATETSSKDLISGLLKLYVQNSASVVHDKLFSRFYFSHPPAEERIDHLEEVSKSVITSVK